MSNPIVLPPVQMTFSGELSPTFLNMMPSLSERKWQMFVTIKGVDYRLSFSEFGIQRLAKGLRAYANWDIKNAAGEWVYRGRYPAQMTVVKDAT